MILLLDTHLLLWATGDPGRLTSKCRDLIDNPAAKLMFSTASIWEIVIKKEIAIRKAKEHDKDYIHVEPQKLRDILIRSRYIELAVRSKHVFAVGQLPLIHKDPFDRMLIAQARVENITLLTGDKKVMRYPGPIQAV